MKNLENKTKNVLKNTDEYGPWLNRVPGWLRVRLVTWKSQVFRVFVRVCVWFFFFFFVGVTLGNSPQGPQPSIGEA